MHPPNGDESVLKYDTWHIYTAAEQVSFESLVCKIEIRSKDFQTKSFVETEKLVIFLFGLYVSWV